MERGNFADALGAWNNEKLKHEREPDSKLSDNVKIAVLMHKTKGQLQKHIRLNTASLSKYQDVREVITKYTKTKQIFNKDPSKDPYAMDIGKVTKGNDKGKGKGNSKGK